MGKKTTGYFIIGTFVTLYLLVSVISTIHVIEFFKLSNPEWLAISLAVAFEVGAAASLASLISLDKMNKGIVWMLFIILTLMQAMGNTYYAYTHLADFKGWVELFGLIDEEIIYQKRVLSIVSGAILPVVALGFIKSLVDYIKPTDPVFTETPAEQKDPEPEPEPQPEPQPEPEIEEEIETVTEEVIEEPSEIQYVEQTIEGGTSTDVEEVPDEYYESIQQPIPMDPVGEIIISPRPETAVHIDPIKIN